MKILLTTLAAALLALTLGGAVQAGDRHDKHQDHSSRDHKDYDRDHKDYDRDHDRDYDRDHKDYDHKDYDHGRRDRDHWSEYDSWYYEQYGWSAGDGDHRFRPLDRK